MEPLAADALFIHPIEGPELRLVWRGKSRDRQPAKIIKPYVSQALSVAADRGVTLEMSFEQIEYFNSATVIAIVQIIHEAHTRHVPLRVIYDESIEWQRLSFDAMRVFAKDGFELCPTIPGKRAAKVETA